MESNGLTSKDDFVVVFGWQGIEGAVRVMERYPDGDARVLADDGRQHVVPSAEWAECEE